MQQIDTASRIGMMSKTCSRCHTVVYRAVTDIPSRCMQQCYDDSAESGVRYSSGYQATIDLRMTV